MAKDSGYDPVIHGPRRVVGPGFHAEVYEVVCAVPAGRVTTYGDIAAALGHRNAARQVGWALSALREEHGDVPWHRVVNASGQVSRRADGRPDADQAARLAAEGVTLTAAGRVDGFAALRHRADGPAADAPPSRADAD